MRKIVVLAALVSISLTSVSLAHDGTFGDQDNPIQFTIGDVMEFPHHEDGADFKGTATVFVQNTGTEDWYGMHFSIYSPTISGVFYDATSVLILDGSSTGGVNPTATRFGGPALVLSPQWEISKPAGGLSSIDIFFYGTPISTGQVVSFTIYTDNTAENLSYFGLAFNPLPIPEPTTLVLLGLGVLTAVRKRK